MTHAVIIAHPRSRSFTGAMAHAYTQSVEASGEKVLTRDLYRMRFDPRLHARELPDSPGSGPLPDVAAERAMLADVEVFALFYPLWFNAPPAMMKGYIDRVFSMGFGYEPGHGGQVPRLAGRKLISFTSSGAPEHWIRDTGASDMLHHLDRHLADVCGMAVVDHVHFGGVAPGYPGMAMEASRSRVVRTVALHFEGAPAPT